MTPRVPRLGPDAPPRADVGRICFADEVAIDFPSVHAVVERMRDAFLGTPGEARPAPYRMEIALSPAEARFGHDVRLVVPIRRTCTACGGRGEIWSDRCEACAGAGDALDGHELCVAVPPGVRDGAWVNVTVTPRHAPATRVELHVSVR
jgi:hypothetical protein